jgi:hypothetical protein
MGVDRISAQRLRDTNRGAAGLRRALLETCPDPVIVQRLRDFMARLRRICVAHY